MKSFEIYKLHSQKKSYCKFLFHMCMREECMKIYLRIKRESERLNTIGHREIEVLEAIQSVR
jgi:hypothetical protein